MQELSSWEITQSVLPVYGLIVLGGVLRKTGLLRREADGSLMKVMINCLYPCLIVDKILLSEAVKDVSLTLWTLPLGFFFITMGLALSKLGAFLVGIPAGKQRNSFAMTCGIQNYGFAAVPIVLALFPADLLGVLFVHSLGVEVALWTVGIAVLQGRAPTRFKSLLSAPIVAVVVGLTLSLSGAGDALKGASVLTPGFTMLSWLGACSFPVGLLLIGATLWDELKHCLPTLRVFFTSAVLRLGILPLLMLGVTYVLPLPAALKLVLVVQAAMPSAVMPIVLSRMYGASASTAGQVVLVTQGLGILTIPFWISFGLELLSP